MKKTSIEAKKNNFVVVAATIQDQPQTFHFSFDDKTCQALAERFDLPQVFSFTAQLTLYRDEFVHVKGAFQSEVMYQSVISLEEFKEKLNENFEVLFSEEPPTQSDEIIDPIERGRIDLKEVLFEQFGLSLNPFPRKKDEQGEFVYQDLENQKENPFHALNTLMKK